MSKQRRILLACATAWFVIPSSAASPYRNETPPVFQPPQEVAKEDRIGPVVKAFQAKYHAAGMPRIALFWNVELIDSVEDEKIETKRFKGSGNESTTKLEETTAGKAGNAKLTDSEAQHTFDYALTKTTQRVSVNAKRTTGLSERDMWKIETSFANTMREAGVRFINRDAILRTTALSEGTDNLKALETKALLGKADLLMEVLMTQDPAAPLGWGFRMNLRDIKSGEDRASLYTEALPMIDLQPKIVYRATDSGFTKVVTQA